VQVFAENSLCSAGAAANKVYAQKLRSGKEFIGPPEISGPPKLRSTSLSRPRCHNGEVIARYVSQIHFAADLHSLVLAHHGPLQDLPLALLTFFQ